MQSSKAEDKVNPDNKVFAKKPKNIIFMIGDGMGISQVTAALIKSGNVLALERMVELGMIKTFSADDLITDSAAGATAFATGKKTYNGAIAVDQDSVPLKTLMEECIEKSYKTGLVATSTIVHATPASYVAHRTSRNMYEDIALDMSRSGVDVMIGGGTRYFETRSDGLNLLEEMKEKGYQITDTFTDAGFSGEGKLMGLISQGHPASLGEGRHQDYLMSASKEAIKRLEGDQPYFLMIEGSQIDWGGHDNDVDYIVEETLEFDEVIGAVLDYIDGNRETLLVVTADHETGGFAINSGNLATGEIEGAFTSLKHTADLIPVYAYGPGAEQFKGIYDNTEIYNKMKSLLGL